MPDKSLAATHSSYLPLHPFHSVNGLWTEWTPTTTCSGTICGTNRASQTMGRTCTNPAPQHGGYDCQGDASKVVACTLACPSKIFQFLKEGGGRIYTNPEIRQKTSWKRKLTEEKVFESFDGPLIWLLAIILFYKGEYCSSVISQQYRLQTQQSMSQMRDIYHQGLWGSFHKT